MKGLSITLIESGNSDCPNIGTIHCETGDERVLKSKAIQALESHFDASVTKIDIQDKLDFSSVKNREPIDAVITLDNDTTYVIEIQQTFIY